MKLNKDELTTGGSDNTTKIIDLPVRILKGHEFSVVTINQEEIASGSKDYTICNGIL